MSRLVQSLSLSRASAVSIGVGAAAVAAVYAVRMRRAVYSTLAKHAQAPVLAKRPHMVPFGAVPGQNRGANPMKSVLYMEDPYFWVRDDSRKNEEVLEHLRKENEYTALKTKHLEVVRKNLYEELLSHVQETDSDYPHPFGPYLYYTRTEKGSSYTFHCRRKKNADDVTDFSAPEELMLDENALAVGKKHCDVSDVRVSPDHRYLAYMVDFSGYETYTGYIKDLETGKLLPDRLNDISELEWGSDSTELFYGTQDEAHRQNKVWRHTVGSKDKDECLYTEDDELFSAYVHKSRSGKFVFIVSASSETREVWFLDFDNRDKGLQVVSKRVKGVIYSVDHRADRFYIVTNKDKATNFKLVTAPVETPGPENWKPMLPYDPATKIDHVDCFKNFVVVNGRQDGFTQLWIVKEETGKLFKSKLVFDEASYTVGGSINRDYDTGKYRFFYTSMTRPLAWYDYDLTTKEKTLLKKKPCPNYDSSLYKSERLEATASDGTKIPISLVYRTDLRQKDQQPLHLYGYGSYEVSIDPSFSSTILPMLDRGVIYAIAHIRGGGEMGRTWYEGSKYTTKKNTFTDFIACAEHLIKIGLTSASMMSCEGRSAGGLLMGAVLNMRPDLFTAAVAGVPFVDVMSTMSDASIPLTTGEWEEWGNPNEAEYFQYMLSYSPYENVKQQAYPNILVTSGLYDPRVAYWEPTKWVARLRDTKSDQNDVLLKMDLSSGHFSASDRYHYLKEKAFDLAFLLDHLKRVRSDDKERKPKKEE